MAHQTCVHRAASKAVFAAFGWFLGVGWGAVTKRPNKAVVARFIGLVRLDLCALQSSSFLPG
jgi:hypothetical protein